MSAVETLNDEKSEEWPNDICGIKTEKLDFSLIEATLQSINTQSMTPLIKEELKLKIQSSRLAAGKDELPTTVFKEPEKTELTPEEEERRKRRRERNRLAALKCRNKKKCQKQNANTIKAELELINFRLKQQIEQMEEEKQHYLSQLKGIIPNPYTEITPIASLQSTTHEGTTPIASLLSNEGITSIASLPSTSHEGITPIPSFPSTSLGGIEPSAPLPSTSTGGFTPMRRHSVESSLVTPKPPTSTTIRRYSAEATHTLVTNSFTDAPSSSTENQVPSPVEPIEESSEEHLQDELCKYLMPNFDFLQDDLPAMEEEPMLKEHQNFLTPMECRYFLPLPDEAKVPGDDMDGFVETTSPSLYQHNCNDW